MKTLVDREDLIFSPPELGCVLLLSGLPGGNSKIHDRSPYSDVGTITGANWMRTPGGLWCLSFDGIDDHVTFIGKTVLGSKGTLSMWTNPDFAAGVAQRAFGGWADNGTGVVLLSWNNGNCYWGWLIPDDKRVITTDAFPSDWFLIHLTWSTETQYTRLYWDTEEIGNQSGLTSVPTLSQPYCLGSWHQAGSYGKHFLGKIALVRFYNRVLSAHERQNQFNQEKNLVRGY